MMGFVCNSKGQLEKIDFSNAGERTAAATAAVRQPPAAAVARSSYRRNYTGEAARVCLGPKSKA